MNWRFVARTAYRESRSSKRRMLVYACAIAAGVAALVAIESFRSSVESSIREQSRSLLGADLELSRRSAFDPESAPILESFERAATATARVTRFSSMALAEPSGQTRLVFVQAIEGSFPLYGELRTEPAGVWPSETPIAVVDPGALIQLGAEVGDRLRLGEIDFRIAATVARAPGSVGMRETVAPRVFIPARFLNATRLMQPGSLARYSVYYQIADADQLDALLDERAPELRDQRIRSETVAEYAEELTDDLGRLTRFLGLVGLVALLLGGVGVATGVHVFVMERLRSAAVLRCLGARQNEILAIYVLQALLLGSVGSGIGAALGIAVQAWLPEVAAGMLPLDVRFELSPRALASGVLLGVWITLLFAVSPLLQIRGVSPLRALRPELGDPGQPGATAARHRARWLLFGAGGASLFAVALWQAPSLTIGLYFAGGLTLCLALLHLAALGLMALTRRAIPRSAPYWIRQGVANLFRPQNQTQTVTLSLGLGVLLLTGLHVVQHDLLRQLDLGQGAGRPNMAIFDIQQDQRVIVSGLLEQHQALVLEETPIVPARLVATGNPTEDDSRSQGRAWALGRQYRLTYRAAPSESEEVVAGRWWTANDTPLSDGRARVSLEQELASDLGVGVGDRITWDIQGLRIESVVTNLRRVDWARFRTNFFAVFEPGFLEQAPQSFVVLGRMGDDAQRAQFQRELVLALPNVSVLDATAMLDAIDVLLTRVALAIRFMALFAIASGLLILIGALATSRYQRARESVLLRTLGAPAGLVRRVLATEYFALGALAGCVGSILAAGVGWAVLWGVFSLSSTVPILDLCAVSLATALATAVIGLTYGREALRQTPLAGLRRLGA